VPRHKLWSDDDPHWHPADAVAPAVTDLSALSGLPAVPDLSADHGPLAEDVPGGGDRWSTWDRSGPGERGPEPHPDWLVTELAAVDIEYGVLKTGKEADVFLLRRGVPDTDRSCLLAAKRYRDSRHRQFHRDVGYQEGRRARKSREGRAMERRTSYGRELAAGQWARAEFAALCQLHRLGAAVPYPVQIVGTEVLLEFVGDPDGTAAPRLAEVPLRGAELDGLWAQAVELLTVLAGDGLAHGDLSAYNLLVHGERLVMIDLPQVVDVIGNPQGPTYLDRDTRNVATWFAAHGRPTDADALVDLVRAEARLT
jgi:RIO kinase 1